VGYDDRLEGFVGFVDRDLCNSFYDVDACYDVPEDCMFGAEMGAGSEGYKESVGGEV
jgi:hypothetical protein